MTMTDLLSKMRRCNYVFENHSGIRNSGTRRNIARKLNLSAIYSPDMHTYHLTLSLKSSNEIQQNKDEPPLFLINDSRLHSTEV
jgi:hypothetical protein